MIAFAFLVLTFVALVAFTVNLLRANREGRVTITRGRRTSVSYTRPKR